MIRAACVVLLVTCAFAAEPGIHKSWEKFKSTFKKQYDRPHEEIHKKNQWTEKVSAILKHNLEADMGIHSYTKSINKFSDMSKEEFRRKALGLKIPKNITYNYLPAHLQRKSERALPASFDWRDQNAVTTVKEQGGCGSCWSFSTAGALEGMWAIRTGELVDFSEQELIDCGKSYDLDGCDGGWPSDALKYVQAKGLEKYSCYPYEEGEGKCRRKKSCMITKISTQYSVPKTEKDLQQYLYDYGPVSITVNANDNLSDYESGIFEDSTCDDEVNHAVLLVGYGVEGEKPYWIVKNSWGADWGENGYIRILRGKGLCGIEKYAVIPWLDD